MKTKLVLKLSILLFGLLMVVMFRNFSEKGSLANAFNTLFGITNEPKVNWCADHVVDVVWLSSDIPDNLKKLDIAKLRSNYCELKTEAIQGVDLDQVKWAPLAESSGATGKKSVLEWNKELGLFRSGGLPFKSSVLSRELVDK